MRETQVIIERVRRLSADLQQLDLAIDRTLAQIRPGQSLFASPLEADGWNPYLREQWIPVDLRPGRLTVELPTGRTYTPGQAASVLAPVGEPIPLRANLQHMLMIAEDAFPTPLVQIAHNLLGGGVSVTLVLGGKATFYPLELLSPEIEILRSDTDWKWPDQVETLQWADQVLVLAPTYLQAEVYGRLYDTITQLRQHAIPDAYVCGLYYPRLACGTGACQACEVPSRKEALLACADGPAIDLKKVMFQ
jgi:NAD(P)H-flavin reductase